MENVFDLSLIDIKNRFVKGWPAWIDVGKGWYPIIIKLNSEISNLFPDYEIYQIKEKFGCLRYYCSVDGEDGAYELIREAEKLSARTCEICGAPAVIKVSESNWWKTICDTCDEEEKYNEPERDDFSEYPKLPE